MSRTVNKECWVVALGPVCVSSLLLNFDIQQIESSRHWYTYMVGGSPNGASRIFRGESGCMVGGSRF